MHSAASTEFSLNPSQDCMRFKPSRPFSRDIGCQEPICNISSNNSANYNSIVFIVVQLKFAGMRWNHSRDQRGDWLEWLGTTVVVLVDYKDVVR